MKERTLTSEKPQSSLQRIIGDGVAVWVYLYDIQEEIVDGVANWSYIEVVFDSKPSQQDCIRRLIRDYVTQNEEFDIINTYNRAALGMLYGEEKEKAVGEYIAYLRGVDRIKSAVKDDFNTCTEEQQ